MKPRYLYLDIIRIIACFMVVVMHSMRGGENANGIIYVALDTFAKPCNALFFMTSGALLLPVKTGGRLFLSKRLSKVIIPCILWTIIYNITKVAWSDQSIIETGLLLINIPFSDKAYGILWFIYVLIGLYLVAPIISPWLQSTSHKNVKAALIIWCFSLIFLIFRNYIYIPANEKQMLYYFSGYIGYFILGYYLHRYHPRMNNLLVFTLILLPYLIALIIRTPLFSEINPWSVLGYLSFFTALCAFAWFIAIQRLSPLCNVINHTTKRFITRLSNLTFGVYLTHIIVRNALWHFFPYVTSNGCIMELLLTISLTFLLSFCFTYLIANIPFANYIIGYKNK